MIESAINLACTTMELIEEKKVLHKAIDNILADNDNSYGQSICIMNKQIYGYPIEEVLREII